MKILFTFLTLAVLAAPAFARVEFNSGAAITADGNYVASKVVHGGGIVLWVTGTFDGASVALQGDPDGAGAAPFAAVDSCDAVVAAGVCRAAPGPVNLRVAVTSAGASTSLLVYGFEARIMISSAAAGGGATGFDAITGGTNTAAAMVVGTGASLGISGTGTIAGTSLDWDGDGNENVADVTGVISFDIDDDGVVDLEISKVASRVIIKAPAATPILQLNVNGRNAELDFSSAAFGMVNSSGLLQGAFNWNATNGTTIPSILTYQGASPNTGFGYAGADITAIRSGSEISRSTATGFEVTDGLTLKLPVSATAPASATGRVYFDSSEGAPCFYDGSGWKRIDNIGLTCS